MTTLADINQTLMVQNEMQKKTTKAVDSLTKRFAAFLRVAKGDRLEDLESRREARRQSRAMGFASRAKGAASAVKNNIGLISKILGGLALGAFVLQNDELRASVMDFITTAGEGIATFFKSDEFREILGATFSAAGEVFTSLLGTVWETDGGKKMLIGLGVALAAIFAGPAVIAAISGAIATALLNAAGKALFPTGGGRGNIVEKRGERAKALQQQRVAGQSPRTGPRGFAGRAASLGKSLIKGGALLSAVTGFAGAAFDRRGKEAGMSYAERGATGTVSGFFGGIPDLATGAGAFLSNTFLGTDLQGTNLKGRIEDFYYGQKETVNELEVLVKKYNSGVGLTEEEKARLMSISRFNLRLNKFTGTPQQREVATDIMNIQNLLSQGIENPIMPSTGDPILDAAKLFGPSLAENTVSVDEFMGRVIPLTELPAPGIQRDVQARFEGMRQNMIEPLVQSKVPALEQAMDGAGTGAPIVVPVPIPMDAGKGPGPAVVQGTVGGNLSAGETIHLNQDPGTIIGGAPRQQSGGGGGW